MAARAQATAKANPGTGTSQACPPAWAHSTHVTTSKTTRTAPLTHVNGRLVRTENRTKATATATAATASDIATTVNASLRDAQIMCPDSGA
jgi:hypothetical protein